MTEYVAIKFRTKNSARESAYTNAQGWTIHKDGDVVVLSKKGVGVRHRPWSDVSDSEPAPERTPKGGK